MRKIWQRHWSRGYAHRFERLATVRRHQNRASRFTVQRLDKRGPCADGFTKRGSGHCGVVVWNVEIIMTFYFCVLKSRCLCFPIHEKQEFLDLNLNFRKLKCRSQKNLKPERSFWWAIRNHVLNSNRRLKITTGIMCGCRLRSQAGVLGVRSVDAFVRGSSVAELGFGGRGEAGYVDLGVTPLVVVANQEDRGHRP